MQIARAEANLQRQLEWVSRHDARVSFVFAIDTALFGALAAFMDPIPVWGAAQTFCTLIAIALLCGSLIFVVATTIPRTKAPAPSLIFFNEIAKFDQADYTQHWVAQTDAAYLQDVLLQIHVNSKILAFKFEHLHLSYKLLFAGVPFWALSIYLFN